MIICKACGYKNPDSASFCESCGSFLEWTGEKVAAESVAETPSADLHESDHEEAGSNLAATYLAAKKGTASSPAATAVKATTGSEPQSVEVPAPEATKPEVAESDEAPKIVSPISEPVKDSISPPEPVTAVITKVETSKAEAPKPTLRRARSFGSEPATVLPTSQAKVAAPSVSPHVNEGTSTPDLNASGSGEGTDLATGGSGKAATAQVVEGTESKDAGSSQSEATAHSVATDAENVAMSDAPADGMDKASVGAAGSAEVVAPASVGIASEQSSPQSDLFETLSSEEQIPTGQRPQARAPSALKPQMSRRRAATRSEGAHTTAVREERIDESAPSIICPNCGTANDPARYFCHHCAQVLPPPPPPPPPLTRWQKVKLWFRKEYEKTFYTKPAEAPAGERVGKMWRSAGVDSSNETVKGRMAGAARKGLAGVLALALIIGYLGPFRAPINNAYSRFRSDLLSRIELRYTPVFAVSATASSYLPALPPTNAIDGLSNTYWAAQPTANDGVGQTLTIKFSPSTRLDKIGFIIGADDNPADYTTQPRPEKVKVSFSDGKSQIFTLVDSPSFQSFTIHYSSVSSITITIESVYKSPVGHSVAIAEVLFYKLV